MKNESKANIKTSKKNIKKEIPAFLVRQVINHRF